MEAKKAACCVLVNTFLLGYRSRCICARDKLRLTSMSCFPCALVCTRRHTETPH